MSYNVLVVAPHHDDECIGCGGLLVKLRRTGWDTYVVVVFDPLEGVDSKVGQQRLREAQCAADVLGVKRVGDLGIPCRESLAEEEIIWRLVKVIRSVQPDILLVPHLEERDSEHRKTHTACVEAAWLSESSFRVELGPPAPSISIILGYEVWTPSPHSVLTIDIGAYVSYKLKALRCYASQREIVDLISAADGLSRYRGHMRGHCKWAECYTVERINESALSCFAP